MPETCTDFVIQISTSASVADMSSESSEADGTPVVAELQQYLKPGSEIGLVFGRYIAITSVLWLSGPTADRSVRAGVRLVGVSARPSVYLESAPSLEVLRPVVPS
jgi:hypothetical protein